MASRRLFAPLAPLARARVLAPTTSSAWRGVPFAAPHARLSSTFSTTLSTTNSTFGKASASITNNSTSPTATASKRLFSTTVFDSPFDPESPKLSQKLDAATLPTSAAGQHSGPGSSSTKRAFSTFDPESSKWDDPELGHLIQANQKWCSGIRERNPGFFDTYMTAHKPNILWIGCSDARIPANEVIGEPAGSVFVHRNIANMVVNTDVNCMSVLQYGIAVLKVRHIVVCGHYDCGGIKAALTNVNNISPLENWLRNIRDVHRLHYKELASLPDKESIERRLAELNVIEQCVNLFKTGVVQQRRVETFESMQEGSTKYKFVEPRIHPLVYDPRTGQAKRLNVDFKEVIKDLKAVYELYKVAPSRSVRQDDTRKPSPKWPSHLG